MGMIVPIMGINRIPARPAQSPTTGLANALFSKVQQRVLGVLFGNPERSFYANEMISLAGSGTGAVQRELGKLAGAGLATVRRQGNQKHYQANAASPVFSELRGLVLKTTGLAGVLRVGLAPLTPQIATAFVYGSLAKRRDTAGSDVDLMIVSDTLSYAEVISALEPAVHALGRPINPTVYTSREFARRLHSGKAFLTRVIKQPKIWLIGDENVIAA
jgi:predicted nucleotidyltransferase